MAHRYPNGDAGSNTELRALIAELRTNLGTDQPATLGWSQINEGAPVDKIPAEWLLFGKLHDEPLLIHRAPSAYATPEGFASSGWIVRRSARRRAPTRPAGT